MESLPDVNVLLEAAIAAHAAGLCIIPSKSDGTKAPFGNWKHYQSQRPDEEQLIGWFSGRYSGMGVVCGAVSGRLECLEIEGAFRPRYQEIRKRLGQAGLIEEWDRWLRGYAEISPSGGIHVLVRISGDEPLPGNTKIALSQDCATWIETRGEGGFVIVAPSGGTVHPTGKSWDLESGSFSEIAETSPDLWDAMVGVLASFDESPTLTPSFDPIYPRLPKGVIEPAFGGWIEEARRAHPPLHEVLTTLGWSYVRDEPMGQLWRRPNKDFGHSARINLSGRLINFSSSTPLGISRRSYDAVDVAYAYEHGHPPDANQRTEWLREYRLNSHGTSELVNDGGASQTPAGELAGGLNLPDDFWRERPYLGHVYIAALAARVSPDALWMAVKTLYAATVPWNYRLPDNGTLDYIGIMAGPSGSGKTVAKQAALDLMSSFSRTGIFLGLPPGTGEGMTEFYIKRESDGTQGFKARGAGFYIDEGTWLFDTATRMGNTTIQALKSAWSGELTGSLAGSAERNRFLPPRAVRFVMLIGIQPVIAAQFMRKDLTDGGLPQRVCWSWTQHPEYPDVAPEYPGALPVKFWYSEDNDPLTILSYDDEIKALLSERRRASVTGVGSAPLNGHEAYAKLKSAALHALMDGRTSVTEQDWLLASMEWETSEHIRTQILASEKQAASDSARGQGVRQAESDEAAFEVHLERAVMRLARKLQAASDGLTVRQIKDALSSYRQRYGISVQEVIDHATRRGLLIKAGDTYLPGSVKP